MRIKAKAWGVIGGREIDRSIDDIIISFIIIIIKKINPNCKPYSSPHQVPKHLMLWHIEKGTLREVGKIDA